MEAGAGKLEAQWRWLPSQATLLHRRTQVGTCLHTTCSTQGLTVRVPATPAVASISGPRNRADVRSIPKSDRMAAAGNKAAPCTRHGQPHLCLRLRACVHVLTPSACLCQSKCTCKEMTTVGTQKPGRHKMLRTTSQWALTPPPSSLHTCCNGSSSFSKARYCSSAWRPPCFSTFSRYACLPATQGNTPSWV